MKKICAHTYLGVKFSYNDAFEKVTGPKVVCAHGHEPEDNRCAGDFCYIDGSVFKKTGKVKPTDGWQKYAEREHMDADELWDSMSYRSNDIFISSTGLEQDYEYRYKNTAENLILVTDITANGFTLRKFNKKLMNFKKITSLLNIQGREIRLYTCLLYNCNSCV